jgi:carboxypeptidase C (cathepsin A)
MSNLLSKGYALNGVIMVSAVFDLRTLFFAPNEDLAYVVYLPTMAATSWYHNKVANKGTDLPAFVEVVRSFTENHYAPALYKGNRITAEEKNVVAKKLAEFTGIQAEIWERADLKINAGEYFQELLRGDEMTVGRLDSRYKGMNMDPMSMNSFTDPQSDAISPAYTMGFLDYYHGALGVSKDLLYATSAYSKEGFKWDWKHQGNNFWGADAAVTTIPDMEDALSKDPNVKILIMNGYYDMATVFHGVEHSISHIDLPKSATDRIIMTYYEAGHMMYTHLPSAKLFREDLKRFIQDTTRK